MLRKLLLTFLLALHLIGCTPTDKAALDQLHIDAPTFITLPTDGDNVLTQK